MNFNDLMTKLERAAAQQQGAPSVVMGFDGFVDRIARNVMGTSGDGSAKFTSMAGMGSMLSARGEHSVSIELTNVEERVGGNMPITASAMGTLGIGVDCFGAFGYQLQDPVFHAMPKACRLHSFAKPGHCLALEFDSCKLFLADNGELDGMDWALVHSRIGGELKESLSKASLIGLFNWGELKPMQQIWRQMAEELMPGLPQRSRTVLVDPADCSRRTREEMLELKSTLRLFARHSTVALSVNDGELRALAAAMDIEGEDCMALGRKLQGQLADILVLHSGRYAAAWHCGQEYMLPTCYVESPALLTGGGDCFNAGFGLGLLAGCSVQECLACANSMSRCYVKNGEFPLWDVYMDELKNCNELWEVRQ